MLLLYIMILVRARMGVGFHYIIIIYFWVRPGFRQYARNRRDACNNAGRNGNYIILLLLLLLLRPQVCLR